MPWKNGLGVTAEIDRIPGGDGPYLWRLSQATIQADAPFSVFENYDRWLAVWRGGPIFLNDRKLEPLDPVRFPGDEDVFCRLDGPPALDVGLIFDRTKVNAEMRVTDGFAELSSRGVHYVFDLGSGDTLKLDHAAKLSVGPSLIVSVWGI